MKRSHELLVMKLPASPNGTDAKIRNGFWAKIKFRALAGKHNLNMKQNVWL